ncbi:cobalamin biosynthesis protein [Thermomonas sp.]|uniref:cobalamin biosynthesis protein n=1 Tax=Thermomonas sp. TaxID=1971895 RepID=UPI0026285EDC|nr:cobalamin biosynthesis protein [Thermomonas sp.]MBL0228944.1 cobalamin biosynthesis protein [Thermomonas sp.]
MAATLLAVIVALAVGHLAPDIATGVRQHGWFGGWLRWLNAQFPEGSFWRGRHGIALALAVPLLVVGLFQVALREPLWGFVGVLFAVVVLFHCWGPRDLDLDVAGVLDAPDAASRRHAASRLWAHAAGARMDGPSLVEAVFRNALRRWFGVLFWFLLLGPFGAVLYRLSVLAVERDDTQLAHETAAGARAWLALLEWPVAQLMTLGLALVGNFDSVMAAWREDDAFALHGDLLGTAARASVRSGSPKKAADYAESGVSASTAIIEVFGELPELRDAMNLAWRILILWLAVIALFVVAGWVG